MEHQIITRAEALEQGLKTYFTGKICSRGHKSPWKVSNNYCLECDKITSRNRYIKDKFLFLDRNKKWHKENRERHNTNNRNWAKNNKPKINAKAARRRAAQLKASPWWSNQDEITIFYELCPQGLEVDHIVPLQSDLVCGLHVLDNLQYLVPEANREKGNRWWPDMFTQSNEHLPDQTP